LNFVIDLDGVIWRGNSVIQGANKALKLLNKSEHNYLLFTNNSYMTRRALFNKFRNLGLETDYDRIATSAEVLSNKIPAKDAIYVIGGPGLRYELKSSGKYLVGAEIDEENLRPVDWVAVGIDPTFNYRKLEAAMYHILKGAGIIATNSDPTYPVEKAHVIPGAGAILSAVETAGGKKAIVVGKPSRYCARFIKKRLGEVDWVIGDRHSTDGLLAKALGANFAFVASGVSESAQVRPQITSENLFNVLRKLL
jgi:4-nitrophenyl phosphatase